MCPNELVHWHNGSQTGAAGREIVISRPPGPRFVPIHSALQPSLTDPEQARIQEEGALDEAIAILRKLINEFCNGGK